MQHANNNTNDYLVRFCNEQKINEAYNGSIIKRGFQEQGMKILYPLHVTGFDTMQDNYNKEVETEGE